MLQNILTQINWFMLLNNLLVELGLTENFDINVNMYGGGYSGQAEALRLGYCKSSW